MGRNKCEDPAICPFCTISFEENGKNRYCHLKRHIATHHQFTQLEVNEPEPEPDETDQDPSGWIYCLNDGKDNVYKCGMTENKGTRRSIEKYLKGRYGTSYLNVYIHHIVPCVNARYSEKVLFSELSEYHVAREFFRVDDLDVIINSMDNLIFSQYK